MFAIREQNRATAHQSVPEPRVALSSQAGFS